MGLRNVSSRLVWPRHRMQALFRILDSVASDSQSHALLVLVVCTAGSVGTLAIAPQGPASPDHANSDMVRGRSVPVLLPIENENLGVHGVWLWR